MTRVKSISQRKHRKIKKAAKGFKQARRQRVKTAKEAVLHAGQYAYIGRKDRKGNYVFMEKDEQRNEKALDNTNFSSC